MNDNTLGFKHADYVALAPHFYGLGFTVDQAKANLKKSGGTLQRYVVYRLPPGAFDAWVDDFGQLHWTWTEEADRTSQPMIFTKRGVK